MTMPAPPLPFAIGDLQGCCDALEQLLARPELAGAPLRFAGDLVNRGPASAQTLRRLRALGARCRTVLGNHDLHLLAVAAGVRAPGKRDTLAALLAAPDAAALIDWLRHQPLAFVENGFLFVHAGVLPQWTVAQTLAYAAEVEAQLQGPGWKAFLANLFGNEPARWDPALTGADRTRVIVNALTRMRFCSPDGTIDFTSKDGLAPPPGMMPWFDVPDRQTADTTIVFGHWSTLGLLRRDRLLGIDTGCVWGGALTAVRLAPEPAERDVIQITCAAEQDPLHA